MENAEKEISLWMQSAEDYALPAWDTLPTIPLYMDQVMMLTGEALTLFERDEKQSLLTSSMINNYVKNGVVEHPVHKRYTREHLAKLIITSMLKQVLSIPNIAVLLSGEANAETLYAAFAAAQDSALHETAARVHSADTREALLDTALRLAAEANARRAASERILAALAKEMQPKESAKEKKAADKAKK